MMASTCYRWHWVTTLVDLWPMRRGEARAADTACGPGLMEHPVKVKLWTRACSGLALLATAALAGGCAHGPARPASPPPAGPAAPAATPAAAGAAGTTVAPSVAGAAHSADPLAGRQLITVSAASYGATYATLAAYRRSAGHWRRVLGPWIARIGRGGFASPGLKREGDGRTRRERSASRSSSASCPILGSGSATASRGRTTSGTTTRPARGTTNGSTSGARIPG